MTSEHEKCLKTLKEALPHFMEEKRFEHTIGVYRECLWLSGMFALSSEETFRAASAALLHDIAKNLPQEEAKRLAEKQRKTLDTSIPAVIHQYTGAMLALETFGDRIVTPEVCAAIACHTTGKAGMTLLDKMLFVSDFTEAGRKYRSCIEIREYLHGECEKINRNDKNARLRVLDEVTRRIVGYTITYLVEKGRMVAPPMLEAWNSMV